MNATHSPKRGGGGRVIGRSSGVVVGTTAKPQAPPPPSTTSSSSRTSFLNGSAVQARLGAMIEILVAASRDTYDNNDLIDEKAKALLPGLVDADEPSDNYTTENDRDRDENPAESSPMNKGLETVATALEKFRSESPSTRMLEIVEDGVSKSIPVPLSTSSPTEGESSETLFREMGEIAKGGNGGGGGGRRSTTKAASSAGRKDGRKSPLRRADSDAVEPPTSDHEALQPKLTRPDANSSRGIKRETAGAARSGGDDGAPAADPAADAGGGYANPYYNARPPQPPQQPSPTERAAVQGKTRYPDYYTPRDHMQSEEYNSRSFPKIGPGYSDTISVVSDLTTPTVATHLVDREYSLMDVMSFQKQSKQMGVLSARELREEEREREATTSGGAAAAKVLGKTEPRGEGIAAAVPKKTGGARKGRASKEKSSSEAARDNERAAGGVGKVPTTKDVPGPREADAADKADDDESVDLVDMAARIAARKRAVGAAAEEKKGTTDADKTGIKTERLAATNSKEKGGKSPKANRSATDRASRTGVVAASKRKVDRKGASASRASTAGAASAAAGSSSAVGAPPAAKDSAPTPTRATSSAREGAAAANVAGDAWDAPVATAAAAAPPTSTTAAIKPSGPTPGGAAEYRRRKSAAVPKGRSSGRRAHSLPPSDAVALPTIHRNRKVERTASGRRRRSHQAATKTKVTTRSLTMQDFAPSGSEMPNFFPPTLDDSSTLGSIPEVPAGKGDKGRAGAGGGNGAKKEHNPKRKNFASVVGRSLLGKKNQRKTQPLRNASTSSSRQLLSMKSDSYGPETIPEQDAALNGGGKKGILRRSSSGASGESGSAGNQGGSSEKSSSGKKNGGGTAKWNQDIATSPPAGERSNIDLEGVLSTMGQDIDFIFRELSALEEDEGGAGAAGPGIADGADAAAAKDPAKGASQGTSRRGADDGPVDLDDYDDEKSIASAYTESTMGATAKIKYTLGSVASTLRSKESKGGATTTGAAAVANSFSSVPFPDGDGTSEWDEKGLSQAGGVAAAPPAAASDPLLIDEDGFIISSSAGAAPKPTPAAPQSQGSGAFFGKGGGTGEGDRGRAGGPQKADSKISIDGDGFLYEEESAKASVPKGKAARKSKRDAEAPGGGIQKEGPDNPPQSTAAATKSSLADSSPEVPKTTARRTKQPATVSSSASSDSKQSRIDAVEAATKRRIDMLRKLVSERANQMSEDVKSSSVPSGGGSGRGGGVGARNGNSGGDKTLNTKLDFVEAETMKQITRLRERLSDGNAGGEGVGGATLG